MSKQNKIIMKNLKKLERKNLKSINGGANCNQYCPPGPYGPGLPNSCDDYHALPGCCKSKVLVHVSCSE